MRLDDDPAAIIFLLELVERGPVFGEDGGLLRGICTL